MDTRWMLVLTHDELLALTTEYAIYMDEWDADGGDYGRYGAPVPLRDFWENNMVQMLSLYGGASGLLKARGMVRAS